MPQNSPCQEVSHLRKVGPCHPPEWSSIPIGVRMLRALVWTCTQWLFLASVWGSQTAGMPRRIQELKTPEVAFGYLWGWRPKSWSCRKMITFGSHAVCSMLLHQVRP